MLKNYHTKAAVLTALNELSEEQVEEAKEVFIKKNGKDYREDLFETAIQRKREQRKYDEMLKAIEEVKKK